eukprot:c20841_g2_i1 orf=9-452(-)
MSGGAGLLGGGGGDGFGGSGGVGGFGGGGVGGFGGVSSSDLRRASSGRPPRSQSQLAAPPPQPPSSRLCLMFRRHPAPLLRPLQPHSTCLQPGLAGSLRMKVRGLCRFSPSKSYERPQYTQEAFDLWESGPLPYRGELLRKRPHIPS